MMAPREAVLLVLALFGFASGGAIVTAQQEARAAGFVVKVEGPWEMLRQDGSRSEPVKVTATLHEGDRLRPVSGGFAGAIIVASYAGEMTTHVDQFAIAAAPVPGMGDLLWRTIHSRFRESFVTAAVRGGVILHNAVVRGGGGSIVLDAVFAGVPSGSYRVTLAPVDEEGIAAAPAQTAATVVVQQDTARGPSLSSGLYQLQLADRAAAVSAPVWIRVLSGTAFDQASADFATLTPRANADATMRSAYDAIQRTYLLLANGQPLDRR